MENPNSKTSPRRADALAALNAHIDTNKNSSLTKEERRTLLDKAVAGNETSTPATTGADRDIEITREAVTLQKPKRDLGLTR